VHYFDESVEDLEGLDGAGGRGRRLVPRGLVGGIGVVSHLSAFITSDTPVLNGLGSFVAGRVLLAAGFEEFTATIRKIGKCCLLNY